MSDYFRTFKISEPRFEFDGLRFVTVKSKHLGHRGSVTLFIPENINESPRLNVHILLHGVYGSSNSWAFQAGAHKTAQRLIDENKITPCILAMPSDGLWGDGSGYIDHEYASYEKWIVEDLPAIINHIYPDKKDSTNYCIAGLSMGGYGTLILGAKYAHQFKAISAHSSITKWIELQPFVEENIYNINNPNGHEDAIDLLKTNRESLPSLRFDCGVDDDLLAANRLLHKQLTEAGIDHVYEEFPGGHEWPYWEEHLVDTLLFFESNVAKTLSSNS